MSRNILAVAALCLAGFGSGCASIIKGSGPDTINVRSMPSEADVKVVDVKTGEEVQSAKTPAVLTLKKSRGFFQGAHYKVTVAKEGFETREVLVDARPNGWYIGGNLIFGGLVGWIIVDPATGAMWTLDPSELTVELKATEAKPADPAAAPVASVMTIDELQAQHPELVSKLRAVAN